MSKFRVEQKVTKHGVSKQPVHTINRACFSTISHIFLLVRKVTFIYCCEIVLDVVEISQILLLVRILCIAVVDENRLWVRLTAAFVISDNPSTHLD
jgi:hypothetical protein